MRKLVVLTIVLFLVLSLLALAFPFLKGLDKKCKKFGFDSAVVEWKWKNDKDNDDDKGEWAPKKPKKDAMGTSVTGTNRDATWNVGTSGATGIIVKGSKKINYSVTGATGTEHTEHKDRINSIIFCKGSSGSCGNDICESGEDSINCENDCPIG